VLVGGGHHRAAPTTLAARPDRLVAALVSVDRVRTVCDLLTDAGYRVAGTALQASRLARLPSGSIRLAALNPVVVVWGELS
jgi:precorrin-6Y C5,15-methyltransferase (decarboxylating)